MRGPLTNNSCALNDFRIEGALPFIHCFSYRGTLTGGGRGAERGAVDMSSILAFVSYAGHIEADPLWSRYIKR